MAYNNPMTPDKSIPPLESTRKDIPYDPIFRSVFKMGINNDQDRQQQHGSFEVNNIADNLSHMLNIQTYRVPPPLPFDPKYCSDLNHFFNQFEKYCDSVYPKARSEWARVLDRFLTGEAKAVYDSVDGGRKDYDFVKEKLVDIFLSKPDNVDERVNKFFAALRMPVEGIKIYALRLEELVKNAFPNVDRMSRDNLLRVKIQSSLSDDVKFQVNLRLSNNSNLSLRQYLDMVSGIEACVQGREVERMKAAVQEMNLSKQSACNIAVVEKSDMEEQKKTGAIKKYASYRRNEQFCTICKWNNHVSEDCYYRNDKSSSNFQANSHKNLFCTYCKKPNHTYDRCYLRLGLCVICQDSSHIAANCPQNNKTKDPSLAPNILSCAFCGGNHLMKGCEEFLNIIKKPPLN